MLPNPPGTHESLLQSSFTSRINQWPNESEVDLAVQSLSIFSYYLLFLFNQGCQIHLGLMSHFLQSSFTSHFNQWPNESQVDLSVQSPLPVSVSFLTDDQGIGRMSSRGESPQWCGGVEVVDLSSPPQKVYELAWRVGREGRLLEFLMRCCRKCRGWYKGRKLLFW